MKIRIIIFDSGLIIYHFKVNDFTWLLAVLAFYTFKSLSSCGGELDMVRNKQHTCLLLLQWHPYLYYLSHAVYISTEMPLLLHLKYDIKKYENWLLWYVC